MLRAMNVRPSFLLVAVVALSLSACGSAGSGNGGTPTNDAPATGAAGETEPDATEPDATEPEATEPADSTAEPGSTTDTGGSSSAPGDAIDVDLSRLAKGETPAGWVEVRSADGACRQAVPADWFVNTLPGSGQSPDLLTQSLLSNDSITDFQAQIDALKTTYFNEKTVLLENDEVFLMRENGEGASYILAKNGGNHACEVLLTITKTGPDDNAASVIPILYSLATATPTPTP